MFGQRPAIRGLSGRRHRGWLVREGDSGQYSGKGLQIEKVRAFNARENPLILLITLMELAKDNSFAAYSFKCVDLFPKITFSKKKVNGPIVGGYPAQPTRERRFQLMLEIRRYQKVWWVGQGYKRSAQNQGLGTATTDRGYPRRHYNSSSLLQERE